MAQQIKTKFIEDLAITTAKINTAAVTSAKLAASIDLSGTPTAPNATYGTSTTQIATTSFVQAALNAAVAGLKPKEAVRAAVSTNVAIATALENGDAAGGVTLATGNRVLLYGQTAPEENGIYVVPASGAATRATDFDGLTPIDEINKAWVPVQEGTDAGKVFVQYGTVATVGTDPITFTFYDPISALVGGDMITKSGSTFTIDLATTSGLESTNPGNAGGQLRIKLEASNPSLQITGSNELAVKLNASGGITSGASGLIVGVDNSTIELNTNALRVKDLGITNAKIANATIDLTAKVTGILPVANGGTGANTLAANAVLLGNGTSALQTVAPGTSGNILTSNGTTWTSAAPSPVYVWGKETNVLDGTDITNQYVDLAEEVQVNSLVIFVGRLGLHLTTDYTTSVVGGVTRITFANSVATGGDEALVAGDTLFMTYQY